MAKTTKKPTNRKARQAAEAAAAKARAEQAQRDRRNQTIIGAVVVAVVIALIAVIGFNIWKANHPTQDAGELNDAWSQVEAASPKPANSTEKGGFVISKNGLNKPVKGVPTVAVYMDFMCPGCGAMERALGDTYSQLVDAGQINIEIHPMSFMDRYSTDEYSTRAANAAIEIAEKEPEHLLKFITLMYAEDFQPSESDYKPVSNAQIKQRAIDAGVSESVAASATDGKHVYGDWLKAISKYTPLRQELWNVEGQLKGQMSTPTITVNGKYWNRNSIPSDTDQRTAFLKAIGLDANAVGTEGKLPSVGTDKGPLYP
ncbi:disulfide bond formation protein DsbA [Bifidobacterium primatium]|uniref:Disulfide bond formation protein DsbA n=1 Tax=Bifidobacterium primatium TaxID=2045438 RepID=A0A2M9HBL3_9BIFI|nr:thioredoxin domain-containing protein [Bifidobacterium primatium]PJM74200.1 disulfide bond formation protein DsbA [Bifidobacterium primatium]